MISDKVWGGFDGVADWVRANSKRIVVASGVAIAATGVYGAAMMVDSQIARNNMEDGFGELESKANKLPTEVQAQVAKDITACRAELRKCIADGYAKSTPGIQSITGACAPAIQQCTRDSAARNGVDVTF